MPKFPVLLVFALGGWLISSDSAAQAPAPVEIELRPQVIAADRHVVLGDVAWLRTTNLSVIQKLAALPLGEAPAPGRSAFVDRSALTGWIRTRADLPLQALIWQGAERAEVRSAVQVLPAAQIEQTARIALAQWLTPRAARFDLQSDGSRQALNLPPGRVELLARPFAPGLQPSARMVAWVDVWVEGAFARTVPVTFAVQAFNDAWVLTSAASAGATLNPAVLQRREVDFAASPVKPLPATSRAPDNLRSLRASPSGEVLTSKNTARVSAVGRGEWVTLHFKSGQVQLEGRVEALQDADLGQRVRVRMPGASQPLEAMVIARGRVEATP